MVVCSLLVELLTDIFPLDHDSLWGKELALFSLTFSPRLCGFVSGAVFWLFRGLPTHLAVVLVYKSLTFAVLSSSLSPLLHLLPLTTTGAVYFGSLPWEVGGGNFSHLSGGENTGLPAFCCVCRCFCVCVHVCTCL